MPQRLALVVLLAAGCSKPVPIRASYGQLGRVAPLEESLLLMPFVDGRGQVQGRSDGYRVDLPDTMTTSYDTIGDTTYVRRTYHDGGTADITTSYTFGTAELAALRTELVMDLGRTPGVGERVLDGQSLGGDPLDPAVLDRNTREAGVRRALVVEVEQLHIRSDAQSDWLGWAYLLGGTLGLASPFIPLERWNATLEFEAELHLYERGRGMVARERIDQSYHTDGPGLPGWRSVMNGAVPWAFSHASADIAEAGLRLARQGAAVRSVQPAAHRGE